LSSPVRTSYRVGRWETPATLVSLLAGLAVGIWLHHSAQPDPIWALPIEAAGAAFLRLLQMVVLPLVWCLVVGAIGTGSGAAGAAGARTLVIFLLLILLGSLVSLLVTLPLLSWVPSHSLVAADVNLATPTAQAAPPAAPTSPLARLVPENPVRAAVDGNLVQVVVFAIFVGVAITRREEGRRERLLALFRGGADALLWLIQRFLRAAPVFVFAFALKAGRDSGAGAAGVLAQLVVVITLVLLVFTLLLIPLGAWASRTSLAAYARALFPVQVLGLTTRSSLAATPAVLEAALVRLRLSPREVEVAAPLCAATFKPHGTPAHIAALLFLARAYGLPVEPLELVVFMLTVTVLSFTMIGLPDGGGVAGRSLPAYVAMGIPVDGYVLSRSIDTFTDYSKTLVNVTGHLTATALCARAATTTVPAPEGAQTPTPRPST
jgi:Na+/H+-dicarboxylate symporter